MIGMGVVFIAGQAVFRVAPVVLLITQTKTEFITIWISHIIEVLIIESIVS